MRSPLVFGLLLAAACGDPATTPADSGADAVATDAGPVVDAGDAAQVDASKPPTPCESIAPSADAAKNRKTIADCLTTDHEAFLVGGTYPISDGIPIFAGATLKGLSTTAPTLVLQHGGATNSVIALGANATLQHLRVDGNSAIGNLSNAATVGIGGPNATVDDVEIFNAQTPPVGYHVTGVYFIGSGTHDNVVKASKIYNHHYGVIFRSGYTHGTTNRVTGTEIHDTKCDGITFVGYGESVGNTIHDTGFDCENGPIPGAAYYSLDNPNGALIQNDVAHDTCGNVIDIDTVSQLTITGGTFSNPGNQFGGKYTYCGGGKTGAFLDVSDSTFTNNTFENSNRPQNAGADSNQLLHATNAAPFSDVTGGNKAVIAVLLARRPNGAGTTENNHFDSNVFRATIASPYVGVGLFTSRGTGYDAQNAWSSSTTNYFTGNVTFGSNVGSNRCGGDWFAGNSTCVAGSKAPCNDDDYQHTGTFHGDGCSFY